MEEQSETEVSATRQANQSRRTQSAHMPLMCVPLGAVGLLAGGREG